MGEGSARAKSQTTSFPEKHDGPAELTLHIRDADHPATIDGLTPQAAMQLHIERENGPELVVNKELIDPDILILATQKSLSKKNKHYRSGDVLYTANGELNIRVSEDQVNRALCLMDTVVKVLRKRGYQFAFRNGLSYIVTGDEEIEVSLRETSTVVEGEGRYPTRSYVLNGKFELKFSQYSHTTTGKDGKVSIEEQLAKIFARLELMVEDIHIQAEKSRIWKMEYEEKERQRKAHIQRKQMELDALKKAMQDSDNWQKTVTLRLYIDAVENKALQAGEITEETRAWIAWARQKADWYDPLTEATDDWLDDTDRTKLQGTEPVGTGFSFYDQVENEKVKKSAWPLLPWYSEKTIG